jgi:hypothetical protein
MWRYTSVPDTWVNKLNVDVLRNIGHGAIIIHAGMQPPLPFRPGKVAEEGTSTIPRDCARVPLRGCQRYVERKGR